jgi:oligoendopeptidase F
VSTSAEALPRWDLTPAFPAVESAEFRGGMEHLGRLIADLEAMLDSVSEDDRDPAGFDSLTTLVNEVFDVVERLGSYAGCSVSADARDEPAQAAYGEVQRVSARLEAAYSRYVAWVGRLDAATLDGSAVAADHTYPLDRIRESAQHLMSPEEEALAAELRVTGGSAWARLQADLLSGITVSVDMEGDGVLVDMPMTAARALAPSDDRNLRRRAYVAELQAWQHNEVPFASALNAVKGETISLARRRGWGSPLDAALFENGLTHPELQAMIEAVEAAAPDLRRHLKAKARALSVPVLAWYDLEAPLPESAGAESKEWSFGQAMDFVASSFGTYSEQLADLARRAQAERWIDAEVREGKAGGGFCARLHGGASRILVNFEPSFQGVSVLAHELGHAFHNLLTGPKTPLQRDFPSTVAETASMFCEQIAVQGAIAQAGPAEALALLEAQLQRGCELPLEILSRFRFEESLYEAREGTTLSARELCELTVEAQQNAYGDALDADALHPYLWAVKPHYYFWSFYNFAYVFGELLGRGLYARFQSDPDSFRAAFDGLLADAGLASPADLAARLGIDIADRGFWDGVIATIVDDVSRYEELIEATL